MRADNTPKSTVWNIIIIAAVGFLLTSPAILHGWSDLGHDSVSHARWLDGFSHQFSAGEWYPRWLTESNSNLGSPIFFYYGPISYYLALPLLAIWPQNSTATWHCLGVGGALALVISGIITYFWLARWAGTRGATVGAVAYMLAPWHTAVGLYNAGSWSLFCAFLWIPLAFLGAERLIEERRGAVVLLAIGYSLLVGTHMITAIMFSPVLLLYPLFLGPPDRRLRLVFYTSGAMLLGVGIAAIYLLPAALQQSAISTYILRIPGGFYDYRKWFLGADIHSLLDYKMRVLVVTSSMAAAAFTAYLLSRRAYLHGKTRIRMLFWLLVSIGSLFFMTSLSSFLWGMPILSAFAQPPRFNALLTFAVAALCAGAAPAGGWTRSRTAVLLASTFAVAWVAGTAWAASRAYFVWHSDPKGVERLQWNERFREELPEYQPFWAVSTKHGIEAALAKVPGRGLRLEAPDHTKVSGQASIVSWQPRRAVFLVETQLPATLLIGQFYYPGWEARELKDLRLLPLSPSVPDGLITLQLPAGKHEILLRLQPQPAERIGSLISAFSCALAILLAALSVNRRKNTPDHVQTYRATAAGEADS